MSSLLNGGPLSDLISSGIPSKHKIESQTGITVFADSELIALMIGKQEYSSIRTKRYCPFDS